jgi:hypothetical protein
MEMMHGWCPDSRPCHPPRHRSVDAPGRRRVAKGGQVLARGTRYRAFHRHPESHPRLVQDIQSVFFDETAAAILSKSFDCHLHRRPHDRRCDDLKLLQEVRPLDFSMSSLVSGLLAQMGPLIDNLVDLTQRILAECGVCIIIEGRHPPLVRRAGLALYGAGRTIVLVGSLDLAHGTRSYGPRDVGVTMIFDVSQNRERRLAVHGLTLPVADAPSESGCEAVSSPVIDTTPLVRRTSSRMVASASWIAARSTATSTSR